MENELAPVNEVSLHNEDWYQTLLDDCVAIETERSFNARLEILQCNWELGQRIKEENKRMDREKIYGEKIVQNLAVDLGKSTSHIWSCMQVYELFGVDEFDEVVSQLPDGKAISWNKTLKHLGVKKDTPASEKKTIKINEAVALFKEWYVQNVGENQENVDNESQQFNQLLVEYVNK